MSEKNGASLTERAVRAAWSFHVYGQIVSAEPYGSGHINDTFAVTVNQAGTFVRYILQRVNRRAFAHPERLMENVARICDFLAQRLQATPDASRLGLILVRTTNGHAFFTDHYGDVWRMYLFVENAVGYEKLESARQAYEAARAFGEFQRMLTDMPGPRLHETIPGFHDTRRRYENLKLAVKEDVHNRAVLCAAEIDECLTREIRATAIQCRAEAGDFPERVTHNDTKLNNVLIDSKSDRACCVIDLDTCMPGLVAYDFGDLVRTSVSPAVEDESDAGLIRFRPNVFEALIAGFLHGTGDMLTPAEIDSLARAGETATTEVAVRFLTDYLQGDTYFRTHRKDHNLIRCRAQLALAARLEEQESHMAETILDHKAPARATKTGAGHE